VPLLAIHSELWQWDKNKEREDTLVKQTARTRSLQILLNKAGHVNFSDFPLFCPEVSPA
jgi:hypothetical protein